jgi:dCTP diphosphatase
MSKDSLTDLTANLKDFAVKRDWEKFHSPKNLSMALSGEAGELLEHFQWLTEDQSYQLKAEQLKEVSFEMADILIYLLRLSERLNIDLVSAVNEKMAINEKRFPVEKVKGLALRGEQLD